MPPKLELQIITSFNPMFCGNVYSTSVVPLWWILTFLILLSILLSISFKLPFTEGVIADGRRLEAKINQSKRAWCKSHALNLFI